MRLFFRSKAGIFRGFSGKRKKTFELNHRHCTQSFAYDKVYLDQFTSQNWRSSSSSLSSNDTHGVGLKNYGIHLLGSLG